MQETILMPQFSDSDALGHINHLSVARWFEVGRSSLYRRLFPNYVGVTDFLVLVHMEIDYVAETTLDAKVSIRTNVSKVGRTSFTIDQEAWQTDRLCCKGRFVMVYFDLDARKPLPIDDDLRRKIEQWSNDGT